MPPVPDTVVPVPDTTTTIATATDPGCLSPYCQEGYVDYTMSFVGKSIRQELAFDVGVSTIDVPVQMERRTGMYLPDLGASDDGWTVTVVFDPYV